MTGVLGAWYPFHVEHYSHLELQWFMFVPLAIVAALDVTADPTWRRGLWLGVLVALQSLASMYLGLMLACVIGPVLAVRLALGGVRKWRSLALAIAASAAVVVPIVVALAIPYEHARRDHGDRSRGEIESGSAVPGDYLKTSRRLASYSWHERMSNIPERELFPGTSTVVLAAIGLLAAPVDAALPLAAGAAAAFDWSLGVHGATYRVLADVIPPFRNVRVPARFAVIFGSALILLGAFGCRRLLTLVRTRGRGVAVAALVLVVLVDLRITVNLVDYYSVPALYSTVGSAAVVAEFPTGHEIDGMYFSTRAWPRLLSGYSGFLPPDGALFSDLAAFPDAAALDRLKHRGATHLVYNCGFERSAERCASNVHALASNPTLQLITTEPWEDGTVFLYRFR